MIQTQIYGKEISIVIKNIEEKLQPCLGVMLAPHLGLPFVPQSIQQSSFKHTWE